MSFKPTMGKVVVQQLAEYWQNRYDWRRNEALLDEGAFPFGQELRFFRIGGRSRFQTR